jgi:hypothetical protein
MSRLADKVEKCTTWKQLHHAALSADEANEPLSKGVYYSGLRFCSASQRNSKIHDVRNGGAITQITRGFGLRKKVQELLTQ